MPIFDYRCKDCNTVYDVYHKGKEIIEDILCPQCGSRNYVKLVSAPAITIAQSANTSSSRVPSCSTGCCGGACGLE